jgi:hypothetical protein
MAYCDQDCTDLDLTVKDIDGRIASDTEKDDNPKLRFRVPASAKYDLTVMMSTRSVDPCVYGLRLYRR